MTSELGGLVATANYVGYLAGAMAGIFLPRLLHSKVALRISLVVVVVTLAGIPATEDGTAWFMLRLIAGISSALVFTIAVSSMLTHLRAHGRHFVGWAFGRVGAGIALSGILVLIVRAVSNWSTACIASAVLAAVLSAPAWTLKTQQPAAQQDGSVKPNYPRANRWFSAVLVSYALEGIGYIIAGTFPGSSSASRRCHPPRYGLGLQTATPCRHSCSQHSSCNRSASLCPRSSGEPGPRSSQRCCSAQPSLAWERSPSLSECTCSFREQLRCAPPGTVQAKCSVRCWSLHCCTRATAVPCSSG